jgi:hypothetical protein
MLPSTLHVRLTCPDLAQRRKSIRATSDSVGESRDQYMIVEYELPCNMSNEQLTAFVTMLEERQSELKISRFSVNQSTLEDVFIQRITTQSHKADDELKAAYRKVLLLFPIRLEEERNFDASNYACNRTKREKYSLHRRLRRR